MIVRSCLRQTLMSIICCVITLTCLLNLANAEAESTWEQIKERGSIRIGVVPGNEPEFFKDPVTNEWSGIHVMFAREIAKVLGVKLEPVDIAWGNIVAALQAGQIDVMFGLIPTPERAVAVDFTDTPIFYFGHAVLLHEDLHLETWDQLADLKVAVIMGSAVDLQLTKQFPDAEIQRYQGGSEVFAAFQAGRAEVIPAPHTVLALYRQRIGTGKIIMPKPFKSNPLYIGVRRESDKT